MEQCTRCETLLAQHGLCGRVIFKGFYCCRCRNMFCCRCLSGKFKHVHVCHSCSNVYKKAYSGKGNCEIL